jgi:Protein of unknown function (DUF3800)
MNTHQMMWRMAAEILVCSPNFTSAALQSAPDSKMYPAMPGWISECKCPIVALASGLPSRARQEGSFCMLHAYIDDSGRGNPPVYILAGWLMGAEKWAAFSDEWKAALDEAPAIRYFKMKEAATCREGEFLGWRNDARDAKLLRLALIIQKYGPLGIGFALKNADYGAIAKNLMSGVTDIWKRFKDPYLFSCYGLMIGFIRSQRNLGISSPVDFIFDEQMRLSAYVDEAYEFLAETLPEKARPLMGGRPVHKDDKKVLPLQAADMLAWHVRRAYADEMAGAPEYVTAAQPIIATLPVLGFVWDAARIESTIRGAWAEVERVIRPS